MTTTEPANGHDRPDTDRPAGGIDAAPGTSTGYARDGQVYDVLTVVTLLVGGFVVPVVGWLAGVVLLWNGPRWSTGQKWLGTLVWPAVVLAPLVLGLVVAAITADVATGAIVAAPVAALGLLVALPLVFVRLLRARATA